MKTLFLIIVSVVIFCVIMLTIYWRVEYNMKKDAKNHIKQLKGEFFNYVVNYGSSYELDILLELQKKIDNFLDNIDEINFKPFEAHRVRSGDSINLNNIYYPIYILVGKDLEVRIAICEDGGGEKTKLYFPYAMTINEFDDFVDKCKSEYYLNNIEKMRKEKINKLLS